MDFDKPKVYGDTSITDGLVLQLYYTYIWKSCACISYYPAIIFPRIYATISVINNYNILLLLITFITVCYKDI